MFRLTLVGLFFLFLVLPGCGGCRRAPDKTPEELEKEQLERKRREEEAKKPPFDAKSLISRPPTGRREQSIFGAWYKPGHWTCVSLEEVKANRFDLVGELELMPTNNASTPLSLFKSPFQLSIRRDVALSKGQTKSFESLFFVPLDHAHALASSRLSEGRGGRTVLESPHLLSRMASYQYYFVVLARSPEMYGYLDRLDSIRPPTGWDDVDARSSAFRSVSLLSTEHRPALPSHANQWTSIATVLWDDAAPTALEPAQQQAMLDWLHWGGQLILSGPDTLDALKDSFLAPYLPAVSAGMRKLDAATLAELNAFTHKSSRPLRPIRAWSGIQLKKHPQAQFVPGAGELLVERRVGRGRIVASAFRLSDREFIDWPSCDEIYNAMLLRRPSRKYVESKEGGDPMLQWADGSPRFDAARATAVRYFTRDTGVPFADYAADLQSRDVETTVEPPGPGPGIAAWNDFNPVACAARASLQQAARVEVPNRSFVLWVIAGYLVVLVPINWTIFRILGRVEWAWAAAPVIAVICTGTVIKLAQLDIGFVRSQTEVAVAELQGDYDRAHLTRYNALYTSLATSYRFTSEDPGGVVLPFPTVSRPEDYRVSLGQDIRSIVYCRDETPSLSGFHVGSNSTGLVHSEEMISIGGGITLSENADGTCRLLNGTVWTLQSVGLLRKTFTGQLEIAWLGSVPAAKPASGSSVPSQTPVTWRSPDGLEPSKSPFVKEEDADPVTAGQSLAGTLNLRKLLDLGLKPEDLQPGETRLVAWTDANIPGLRIAPASPQARRGIVVIAHLGYGFDNDPQPDANTKNNL